MSAPALPLLDPAADDPERATTRDLIARLAQIQQALWRADDREREVLVADEQRVLDILHSRSAGPNG